MATVTDDSLLREALERFLLEDEEAAPASGVAPRAVVSVAEGFMTALRSSKLNFGELSATNAEEIGGSAAAAAAAAAAWSSVVGERLETSQVSAMLGITRQALAKRQQAGSLIGLPGQRTTWFPVWQFDLTDRCVMPVVTEVISAFRHHLDPLDYSVIAAWARNPQPEDLDGHTPADWIVQHRDDDTVITAARRAAERFAQ